MQDVLYYKYCITIFGCAQIEEIVGNSVVSLRRRKTPVKLTSIIAGNFQ